LPPNYHEVCRKILSFDGNIRFAGIISLDSTMLAAEYRAGLVSLLTQEETQLSVMQSLMRMSIRKTLEGKLGETVYATAVYRKVKRASIMMYNDGIKADAILIVSFDKEADHEAIITEKILPFLEGIGKGLEE
jgi:hypothetical protein